MSIQASGTTLPPPSNPEPSAVAREARPVEPPAEKRVELSRAVNREQLKAAVKSVREYIQPTNDALEFSLNDETDQVIVKIIDRNTKEVIRQMPSEEMIAIAKALDSLKGLLIKQSA